MVFLQFPEAVTSSGSPVAAQKSYEIPSLDEAQPNRCATELGEWIPASEVSDFVGALVGLHCFYVLGTSP